PDRLHAPKSKAILSADSSEPKAQRPLWLGATLLHQPTTRCLMLEAACPQKLCFRRAAIQAAPRFLLSCRSSMEDRDVRTRPTDRCCYAQPFLICNRALADQLRGPPCFFRLQTLTSRFVGVRRGTGAHSPWKFPTSDFQLPLLRVCELNSLHRTAGIASHRELADRAMFVVGAPPRCARQDQ